MHEHEGVFCKTVKPGIIAKIAAAEKNMTLAESTGPTCTGQRGSQEAHHWAEPKSVERQGRPAGWAVRGDGPRRGALGLGAGGFGGAGSVEGGRPTQRLESTWASRGAGYARLLLLDAGAGEAGDGAKTGEGSGEDRPEGTGTAGSGGSGHGNGAPAARQGTRRGAESWRTTTSGAGHSNPQDRDEARGSSSSSSSRITRGDGGGMRLEIPGEEAGDGDELEAVHGVGRPAPRSLQADDNGRAR